MPRICRGEQRSWQEARPAIGGAERLEGVRTLQVTGIFRRVVDGNDTEGDFDVFIELPGKYLRSEKTGTPGQSGELRQLQTSAGQARRLELGTQFRF